MYFSTIAEINAAISKFAVTNNGSRVQYSVLFKKAVCEFITRENIKPCKLAKSVRMTGALMTRWLGQYDEGLYSLEGTFNVSKKSISSNAAILKLLNTEINLLQRKRDLIAECTELGINIQQ